jgi:predicted RNA-binding Zn ribbon-like protein
MEAGNLDDLRIVGGHQALDLVNTVAPRGPGAVETEFLPDPEALVRWAHRLGLVDAAELRRIRRSWSQTPGAGEAALDDVLTLRALIDQALAGRRLDALTRRWAAAMDRSALRRGKDRRVALVIGTEPATMIGDRLADAAVDLLRSTDLDRLRQCPPDEGGCGWLFLDRSRNLSRRWCSMEDCGTHAKVRRLTERRRARASTRSS